MNRFIILSVSLLLHLLFFTELNAQLVNIEKSRRDAHPGFQGNIDLNVALTQNTKQIFESKTSALIQYTKERHTVLGINSIGFMRVEGDNLINDGFQHLRYNYKMGTGFTTIELFTQHQYNSIRLIERRFLVGGGPRFRISETENLSIYIAPLVMYEQELINDQTKTRTDKFKGDLYISVSYDADDKINFTHTTYYQPDISRFSIYRISSETGIQLDFSTKFSFLITFNMLYDSDPPAEIPELFYTLRNGIKFSF